MALAVWSRGSLMCFAHQRLLLGKVKGSSATQTRISGPIDGPAHEGTRNTCGGARCRGGPRKGASQWTPALPRAHGSGRPRSAVNSGNLLAPRCCHASAEPRDSRATAAVPVQCRQHCPIREDEAARDLHRGRIRVAVCHGPSSLEVLHRRHLEGQVELLDLKLVRVLIHGVWVVRLVAQQSCTSRGQGVLDLEVPLHFDSLESGAARQLMGSLGRAGDVFDGHRCNDLEPRRADIAR